MFSNAPFEIREIKRTGTGSGRLQITALDCNGDVGTIDTNVLIDVDVLGDLAGNITLSVTSTGAGGTWQGNNTIGGDLLGSVLVEQSVIADTTISVHGAITMTPPSAVRLNGGMGTNSILEASEINARISAFNVAGRIRTTTDFGGGWRGLRAA